MSEGHDLDLDPARCALLLLDLQRDIIADSALASSGPDASARLDGVVEAAARVLA